MYFLFTGINPCGSATHILDLERKILKQPQLTRGYLETHLYFYEPGTRSLPRNTLITGNSSNK